MAVEGLGVVVEHVEEALLPVLQVDVESVHLDALQLGMLSERLLRAAKAGQGRPFRGHRAREPQLPGTPRSRVVVVGLLVVVHEDMDASPRVRHTCRLHARGPTQGHRSGRSQSCT